jgi:hypothetical protein
MNHFSNINNQTKKEAGKMSAFNERLDSIKQKGSCALLLLRTYAKWIILTAVIIFVILAIIKVSTILGLYFFFSNQISEITGLDHSYVSSLSILSVVITLMSTPAIMGWIIFKKNKKSVLIITICFTLLTIGIVKYKSDHIFFDTKTGKALSYYIKTPTGYKFTLDDDKKYDATFGTAYQPVTRDVVSSFVNQDIKLAWQMSREDIWLLLGYSFMSWIFWCIFKPSSTPYK